MGLFDGLKTMVDLVGDGIAAFKASEALESLAQQAIDEYGDILPSESKALYDKFKELKKKQEETEDLDESNALYEPIEDALMAFMLAVSANSDVPSEFTAKAANAVAELQKANDAPIEHIKERFMGIAKTDEEREVVEKILQEAMAEE